MSERVREREKRRRRKNEEREKASREIGEIIQGPFLSFTKNERERANLLHSLTT